MGKLNAPTNASGFVARPNPWNVALHPATVVLDNLPDSAEIGVYMVTGEKVATLRNNGDSAIEWNGTNDQGEKLARGVYLLRLAAPDGSTQIQKLVLVR